MAALDGESAERLGSISRVTAERHGAIRVGTPAELRQVAVVFAALGMHPVGFYDLRDAARSAVPVVSTAFRPDRRRRAGTQPVPHVHLDARHRRPPVLHAATCRRASTPSSRGARCSRPSCSRSPARCRRRRDLPDDDAERVPQARGRCVHPVRRTGRRRVVRRARRGVRRRRRHRRRDVDAHQPPDAARARHRRAVRAHVGARHHDDRRDPGPAEVGRPGRAAAADLVPRAGRTAPVPHGGRRCRRGLAAGALRRGRGARRRADARRAATATTR